MGTERHVAATTMIADGHANQERLHGRLRPSHCRSIRAIGGWNLA
jgi:hypothetical protein